MFYLYAHAEVVWEDTQVERNPPASYLDNYVVAQAIPSLNRFKGLYLPLNRMESPEVRLALSMVKEAGFDPLVAYKVIQCESGGNPLAHNWNDPNGGSHGLWQVNSVHGLSMEEATDPVKSTEFAIKLMRSRTGLSHWTCYTNLYGNHL